MKKIIKEGRWEPKDQPSVSPKEVLMISGMCFASIRMAADTTFVYVHLPDGTYKYHEATTKEDTSTAKQYCEEYIRKWFEVLGINLQLKIRQTKDTSNG